MVVLVRLAVRAALDVRQCRLLVNVRVCEGVNGAAKGDHVAGFGGLGVCQCTGP